MVSEIYRALLELDVVFADVGQRIYGRASNVFHGDMWSAHVLLRYFALQLAGWVVVFAVAWFAAELFGWPKIVVWIIVGVWAAKDALLYPLVWRAYDHRDSRSSAYPPEGAEGVVLRRLDPEGSVRVAGERWNALVVEGDAPIDAGERVRVTGRDGMTLIVVSTRSSAARNGNNAGS